jgi:PhnB protein
MAKKAAKKQAAKQKVVTAIPKGYPPLIPYLMVKGAARAIEFYTSILGGKERMRMPGPNGSVGHAEIELGSSVLMLADEMPGAPPAPTAASPVSSPGLCLYVKDVDPTFQRALEAGSKELRPIRNQFYGDRSGTLVDPFGYTWTLATHIEDVPPAEMERRMAQAMKQHG